MENGMGSGGAIVSTDETRNADYASDFEQRLNQQGQDDKRKKGLMITAIVLGALAVLSVVVLLLQNILGGLGIGAKQNLTDLRQNVNVLIHLTANGEYNKTDYFEGEIDEDEDLYLNKIIDATKNGKEDKKKFFKTLDESLKAIKTSLKENGDEVGIQDAGHYVDMISEFQSAKGVFEAYSGVDYSDINEFIPEFSQDGSAGIEGGMMDGTFKMLASAKEKLQQSDDDNGFVAMIEESGYMEMENEVSSTDRILAFFYYVHLDYINKLSHLLELYEKANCIQGDELDEVCRLNVNGSEEGVKANDELIKTIEYLKEKMNSWANSLVFMVNNLKTELAEVKA